MKLAILTIYTDEFEDIVDVVAQNNKDYCDKWGYDYLLMYYKREGKDFHKIDFVKNYLDDYDYIWVLDADAKITNHNINWERFIEGDYEMFVCKDINGVNCGSFIIKNTIWSEWLIAWMMDVSVEGGIHCEQDAVNKYLQCFPTQAGRKIKFLEHPSINSYLCNLYPIYDNVEDKPEQWRDGCFVLHLPGLPNEQRIEILKHAPITK